MSRALTVVIISLATLLHAKAVTAQAGRGFAFYMENDAFWGKFNQDSGYTNGVRLVWASADPPERTAWMIRQNPAVWVLRAATFGRAREASPAGQSEIQECHSSLERRKRQAGPCASRSFSLAQTMYTPGDLSSETVVPTERPYAGFLTAAWGVTVLDAPTTRPEDSAKLVFVEASHSLLVGVVGPLASAEETQAMAHWTWAASAVRPRGWDNQLRNALQVGMISDVSFRRGSWEYCKGDTVCTGMVSEGRVWDFTPRSELVLSTHMLRASGGAVARLGYGFPDNVGTLRIPVTAEKDVAVRKRGWNPFYEPHWFYIFLSGDARFVPYNMFIDGGPADVGDDGWRSIRRIDSRPLVGEIATGFAIGNSGMSLRVQLVSRTPEYDVRGQPVSSRRHRYGVFMFALHPR